MKLFNSIKFNGWINTITNVLTLLKKKTLGKSYTALLKADMNDLFATHVKLNDSIKIEKLESFSGDYLLNLSVTRINKWLGNEADLYIAKSGNEIVGYTFIHLGKYNVDGVGTIDLEHDDSLWIGPTFVDKNFRSQGINKLLINISAKCYVGKRKTAFTSANINNVNSIKSFIRNGFVLKDVFICTYSFGKQKLVRLVDE